MKTIEVKIYTFDELSERAKQVAISNYKIDDYEHDYFSHYAIDDDYLFEPKHTEIIDLCPSYADYGKPIFGNTRKVYYDLGRNRHLDASRGIVINNEKMFLEWLEIPEGMHDRAYFRIRATQSRYPDTIIEFAKDQCDYIFSDEERKILDYAEVKFSNHMDDVLNRISEAYEYYFSDECIAEYLDIKEYEFTEDGKKY